MVRERGAGRRWTSEVLVGLRVVGVGQPGGCLVPIVAVGGEDVGEAGDGEHAGQRWAGVAQVDGDAEGAAGFVDADQGAEAGGIAEGDSGGVDGERVPGGADDLE